MPATLQLGSQGKDVRTLQTRLNARPTTLLPLTIDGVFGMKTLARVKDFQARKGLKVDGIVGPKTWAALPAFDAGVVGPLPALCGNSQTANTGLNQLIQSLFKSLPIGAFGLTPVAGAVSDNSPIRMLTDVQQAAARNVFGESLDFSRIFLSSRTGLGNRPFTTAFPDSNQIVQILNLGSFTPANSTLIHELAHAWQSQHHSDPYRFMANSVESQGVAATGNAGETFNDPDIVLNGDYPMHFPYSAYAFLPGQAFSSYAAEQMAQAFELGDTGVRAHMRGVGRNTVDSACVTALQSPAVGDRRIAGVKI